MVCDAMLPLVLCAVLCCCMDDAEDGRDATADGDAEVDVDVDVDVPVCTQVGVGVGNEGGCTHVHELTSPYTSSCQHPISIPSRRIASSRARAEPSLHIVMSSDVFFCAVTMLCAIVGVMFVCHSAAAV